MKVIIAEKPSYAKTIAMALSKTGEYFNRKDGYLESNNYYVTWQFGHLFRSYTIEEYMNSDSKVWREDILPYIPGHFMFKLKEDAGIKKQYNVIRELINDENVDTVIAAGDADEEGNLLVALTTNDIYKKDNINKPLKRLWSTDQTERTILDSLNNLKDISEYENYTNQAYTRTCMDFLLGINLTRKFSLMNRRLTGSKDIFSLGRCNTSIVDIIYEREMEIKNFKPTYYWQLESQEETNGQVIKLVDKDKFEIDEDTRAIDSAKLLNNNKAIVETVENNSIKKEAPKLFSLTSLQGILSDRYKMPMEKSLSLIQSLYEAGYVTYPRTNTEYLSEEEIPKVNNIINVLNDKGYNLVLKKGKGIFNNERIESHSALIITDKMPAEGSLSTEQELVYNTIKNRFIAKFLNEDTIISQTKIKILIGSKSFELKGEVIINKGYFNYEPLPKSKEKNTLPNLKEGDEINIDFKPIKKSTTPPAKLNIKTLNAILENPFRKEYKNEDEIYKDLFSGIEIGTPATRSVLIQNIKKVGYIVEDKGVLSITDKGIYLIETLRALNIDISKNRTVEFSKELKKVFNKQIDPSEAINNISSELINMFNGIKESDIKGFKGTINEKEIIGYCPRCAKQGIERKVFESSKAYYCEGWRDEKNKCEFAIWKEDKFFKSKGKKITKTMVKSILKDGKVSVSGFKKKDSSQTYDADVLLDDTGKYVNFKLEFNKKEPEAIGACPRCAKKGIKRRVLESNKAYYCEGWKDEKDKCGFAMWKENVFFKNKGKMLSKPIAKKLLEDGKAHVRGLKKKDNSGVYDADVLLDDTGEYVNFKLDIKSKS
ncbi:DNA topoisomerase [Clostridium sp.]|uniref:type IA DNA topoisomerase n=1 Tax=Clostridium sp. TaxID=1506 RepID=UPI0039914979